MTFHKVGSSTIYRGRVFDLYQDEVRLPNGRIVQLDIVKHPGAVILVPVDAQGNIWFVRQYRHAAGIELLELPAGTMEKGEDIENCAYRELREEIGMAAGNVLKIGEFFMAPGYSTEYAYIYLATSLQPAPLLGDDDEFIHVERMAAGEAFALAEKGQIPDAKTVAALFLARPHIQRF